MKNKTLATVLAVVLGGMAFSAEAASFNCKKASNATEKAICTNQALGEADVKLTTTYNVLMRFLIYDAEIEQAQFAWLRTRNQCGARVSCIQNQYNLRQRQLDRQVDKDANDLNGT